MIETFQSADLVLALIASLVTGLLSLFGVGAGYRLRGGGQHNDSSEMTERLTTLSEAQAKTQGQLTKAVTTLDHIVTHELMGIRGEVGALDVRTKRLTDDMDAAVEALGLLVSHVPESEGSFLPASARDRIESQLGRRRRWEVTGATLRR